MFAQVGGVLGFTHVGILLFVADHVQQRCFLFCLCDLGGLLFNICLKFLALCDCFSVIGLDALLQRGECGFGFRKLFFESHVLFLHAHVFDICQQIVLPRIALLGLLHRRVGLCFVLSVIRIVCV